MIIPVDENDEPLVKVLNLFKKEQTPIQNQSKILKDERLQDFKLSLNNTDKKMLDFFDKFNIQLKVRDSYYWREDQVDNGSLAKANIGKRIVEVLQGKRKFDTLTEEASHFLIEMLEGSKDPNMVKLFDWF